MAEAGFSLQGNPIAQVHPRLSAQWSHGFFAVHTLRVIGSALLSRGLEPAPSVQTGASGAARRRA